MTLTQLSAFVLVARLGSVTAAARTLGVSEPAVSQALSALRQHLGDPLVTRNGAGMALTPGGTRLLAIASQIVALGGEAESAVRAAKGAPEQLRVVATSAIAEFVATPLLDAYTGRLGVEANCGVAGTAEMAVLVANRLADLALGPYLGGEYGAELDSEPIFKTSLIVVTSRRAEPRGRAHQWHWLVDPSATDPASDTSRLLAKLRIPEERVRVFANQTAAWAAAADGAGVAPAFAHLVAHQVRRGELAVVDTPVTPVESIWHATTLRAERRPAAASALRRFLGTPDAMQLMRSPGAGVPPSRFRPPVYVTIWR